MSKRDRFQKVCALCGKGVVFRSERKMVEMEKKFKAFYHTSCLVIIKLNQESQLTLFK